MATNAPQVDLGRVALTKEQLRTTEIMLYQMADIIDRLLKDRVPYTKIEVQDVRV